MAKKNLKQRVRTVAGGREENGGAQPLHLSDTGRRLTVDRLTAVLVRRPASFFGFGGDATYLWPRWLVLRAVGMVYLVIFAGIIVESAAIDGPTGVFPVSDYLAAFSNTGLVTSFLSVPSLFWLNSSSAMITMLQWMGFVAAVALVLNFWPRMALACCWVIFLSFVTTWAEFSPAQLDRLMLETALLCIPFAPRGIRPGLGAASPPHPLTVCMMRWLLFRIMFESGVVKLVSTDPHWRDFTAMDVMYETAPSPTNLGYWAHYLPHAYHVFEVVFTFLAELVAPLVAVFGGRRGRWYALAVWTAFQIGIQLTCNFGWLNAAGLGVGFFLLDDHMVRAASDRLGFQLHQVFVHYPATLSTRLASPWRHYGLRAVLGLHFALTLYYFAEVCGLPVNAAPTAITELVKPFTEFRSANGYFLYAYFPPGHLQVDFEGSNDRGKTWRTFEYRHVPQQVDQAPSFLAPWFARFEATIQIQSWTDGKFSMIPFVATKILTQSGPVIDRFKKNPFPDRPPDTVRMRRYRLTFAERDTFRRTGHYWVKEFVNDYSPAMYLTEQGTIAQFTVEEADSALQAGDYARAFKLNERQFELGNPEAGYRLAQMYIRGTGVPEDPARAFALFSDLAERGERRARHNLGLCYEYGVGVAVDLRQAAEQYRLAAERGSLLSLYALGVLYADDRIIPRNDVEGMSLLLRAVAKANDDPGSAREIIETEPVKIKQLADRMSAADIARAQARASTAMPVR